MSVLEDIAGRIALRLRVNSAEVLKHVSEAAECIAFLHDHGCTVQAVTIRRDHVTIDIDQPSDWLQGSICVRRIKGNHREIVMVTKVRGCQVQWIEREAHRLLQREG